MSTLEKLQQMRDIIMQVASRHGVTGIRVFGSVARREETPDSDIDFLVVVGGQPSSWFPAGLVLDLEELLGRHVEVVTERGLNPHLRDRVLRDAVAL